LIDRSVVGQQVLRGCDSTGGQHLLEGGRLWKSVERGDLSPGTVRIARFIEFGELHGLDASPHDMAEQFADGLKNRGSLYPGVLPVLEQLAASATLALVTNGLGDIQRARIERLGIEHHFDAVVISAEVGVAKPDPAIFSLVFESLDDPDRAGALMVGDSLSSDMAGAAAFGIDGCWYNPERLPRPDAPQIVSEIASLTELPRLVASARG